MKITVYTVSDCQFSKQEKDYLKSKNLQFEEKNLETNKDFLTEMLAVGDNFAGTPLTRIEKDDGQSVVLKGFTLDKFEVALGFKKVEPQTVQPTKDETATSDSTPVNAQPAQEPTVTEPPPIPRVIEPPQSAPQAPIPPTPTDLPAPSAPGPQPPAVAESIAPTASDVQPTVAIPQESQKFPLPSEVSTKEGQDEKLSSILNDLQSKSNESSTPSTDTAAPKPPAPNLPSIPDPNFG